MIDLIKASWDGRPEDPSAFPSTHIEELTTSNPCSKGSNPSLDSVGTGTHIVMGVGPGVHTHTHSKNGIYLIKYTLSISKGKALDERCMKGHCNSVFSLEELTWGSVGWFGR